MSRRYVERYDERERDYYDRRPVRGGYDDEYEVDIQQERYERRPSRGVPVVEEIYRSTRQPDFLREGYGRDAAGPLVVRDREDSKGFQRDKARTDISVVGSRRGQSPPAEKITKEEIVIKEKIRDNASEAGRSRRSVVGRPARESEEVLDDRRSEVRRIPREVSRRELVEEEVVIRKSDRERDRGREREHDYSPPPRRKEMVVDDREVVFRRADSRPPARHELDREEIYYRDERSPSRDRSIEREERQDFVVRTRGSDSRRRERGYEEDRIVVESRDRERSRPPPRLRSLGTPIARQYEEFYIRKRRPPSPVPRDYDREEITITNRREPSPLQRSPSPQHRDYKREEIIISNRREQSPIRRSPSPSRRDYEREEIIISTKREPSPPPRAPSPISESSSERELVREVIRDASAERPPLYRPPIIQHIYTHHHHIDHGLERARSPSPPPRMPSPPPPPKAKESLKIEIRRQGVHDGEEYREKDVIVDREVDKTEIVKEDKQVTRIRSESSRPLRKDDGSRRDSGRPLRRDMWTEVAKDLVSREALVKAGYNFEESTKNFYVMDYLQLDMVHLVKITKAIDEEAVERRRGLEFKSKIEERTLSGEGRTKEREHIYERDIIREVRDTRDTRSVRSSRQR